jgi:hypothetical protein
MLRKQIENRIKRYASALGALDVEGICDFWLVPGVMSVRGVNTVFPTRNSLYATADALCDFYERRGVAYMRAVLGESTMPLPDSVYCSAHFEAADVNGMPIAGWTQHYTLRFVNNDWRIAFLLGDGETIAWEKLGTPFGSGK